MGLMRLSKNLLGGNFGIKTMKHKIDNMFLLGLYLFLRQLQLSVDRSLNDDWEKLVDYLSSKTAIEKVLDKLRSITTIDLQTNVDHHDGSPSATNRILDLFHINKQKLSNQEIAFIYTQLKSINSFLSKKKRPERETLISLRISLQRAEELVASRIGKYELKGKEFVEHFNQNEIRGCKKLEELVGGSWI
jgi:hypothetical protein